MAAEPVAAEEFAAIRHATHVFRAEMLAGEFKEAVVERAVRTEHHLRAHVVEDRAKPVDPQQPPPRGVQPGDLQEIEINVVRPRDVPLDAVIQAHAEAIQAMRVLQALVDLDFLRRAGPEGFVGPMHERTGTHVVPAAGAGCENEGAHDVRASVRALERDPFNPAAAVRFRLPGWEIVALAKCRGTRPIIYDVFTSFVRRRPDSRNFNIPPNKGTPSKSSRHEVLPGSKGERKKKSASRKQLGGKAMVSVK